MKILASAIVKAQEEYYLAHGSYAASLDDLSITITSDKCSMNQEAVACSLDAIYYQTYFNNSSNHPGQSECSVRDNTNKNAVAVCQAETGKTTPFWTGGPGNTYSAYAY